MPPKLAFSANAYKKTGFSYAIQSVSELGYKGIEVYADYPHMYPLECSIETQEEAFFMMEEVGIVASNINAFTMFRIKDTWRPSFLEKDIDFRMKRIDHTVAAMEMAQRLRCPTVSTEPGGQLSRSTSFEDGLKMFVEGINEVLHRAKSDAILLFEPEPGLLIENSVQAEKVFEQIVDPQFSMNLDIGHFFCVGEDPVDVVKRFAGRFDHVHLEDIAPSREHLHLVPGDGAIDFRALLQALSDISYDGFVTVELYPFEDNPDVVASRAMNYLAPIWKDVFGMDPRE